MAEIRMKVVRLRFESDDVLMTTKTAFVPYVGEQVIIDGYPYTVTGIKWEFDTKTHERDVIVMVEVENGR